MRPVLLLAAGASSGVREGKLQKEFQGKSLLQWSLESLTSHASVSKVHLVCGGHSDAVKTIAEGFPDVIVVMNEDWKEGLATSLQAGLRSLPSGGPGVAVSLADTPFASASTVKSVLSNDSQKICYPVYRGAPGHPKYFPCWCFPHLMELTGDEGAKSILKKFPHQTVALDVEDPGVVRDFDSPCDFEFRKTPS